MSFDFRFLHLIVHDKCDFHDLEFANAQNNHIYGLESPKGIQKHELHNVLRIVFFAVHSNSVIDSYQFNMETHRNRKIEC